MYPADQLGIGYEEADLPTPLTYFDGIGGSVELTKITGTDEGHGGLTYYHGTGDTSEEWVAVIDGLWVRGPGLGDGSDGCLITGDGNLTPGDDAVEDQFAAEYNFYETSFGDNVTLPRTGLCTWELFLHQHDYTEPYTPARSYALVSAVIWYRPGVEASKLWYYEIWRLEGPYLEDGVEVLKAFYNEAGWKDGDQNGPEGTYTGDYSTVTVSP